MVADQRHEAGCVAAAPLERDCPERTVWFHRDYQRFTGGHLKHAHYFEHVRQAPGFGPRMTFSSEPSALSLCGERDRLWPVRDLLAPAWSPDDDDVLFVAGTDWRYLDGHDLAALSNPRINLIQHVRHAHPDTELYGYLNRRAVRLCVSQEVADAILATGHVNGPVLTIPNGVDIEPVDSSRGGLAAGRGTVTIVAYKAPALARELSTHLDRRGVPHTALFEFLDRDAFLAVLEQSDVAVCLPRPEEGFYLPALEAMAMGCVVVTMDCIGNRGFCAHEDNCLVGHDAESLANAVTRVRTMEPAARDALRFRAARTVENHALALERDRFHAVLLNVDDLWRADGPRAVPATRRAKIRRPVVDFMIVGAQKCGTTALGQFLAEHPAIGMSSQKEVHLFDAEEYTRDWSQADIDERYSRYYQHCPDAALRGEATPIYMFLPEVAAELRRYNPALKLIVLLRDPVARAISDYYMQKARDRETMPFWLALLAEPFRLAREAEPLRQRSASREHSYRTRGLYSLQLQNLYRHFPKDQVLVVRRDDLLYRHDAVMHDVLAFLGVADDVRIPQAVVFGGETARKPHRLSSALLRLSYVAEFVRLRWLRLRA